MWILNLQYMLLNILDIKDHDQLCGSSIYSHTTKLVFVD